MHRLRDCVDLHELAAFVLEIGDQEVDDRRRVRLDVVEEHDVRHLRTIPCPAQIAQRVLTDLLGVMQLPVA